MRIIRIILCWCLESCPAFSKHSVIIVITTSLPIKFSPKLPTYNRICIEDLFVDVIFRDSMV